MEKKTLSILIFILLAGFLLRFVNLTSSPPSLNWDEVSHGVNAYSILKTGMDQWGQKFPILNFRAYGDYPTTLNLYLTMPFVAIFGLSEFAIRFPHVILGTLTLLSIYFLTFGVTKNKNVSLLVTFLAAVEPWYLFTSRFVLQSNLSVFFLITSMAFFVNRDNRKSFLLISYLSFLLTLFSYHTTRIFSPLFLVGLLLVYRRQITNKLIYVMVAVFLILSAYILINPTDRVRGNVLFLIDSGAINKIEVLQNKYGKLVANKVTYFAFNFSKNYISYFSPRFLFLNGGTQYQFSVPNTGLIYLVLLPFFYIGLALLIKKSFSDTNYQMLLLWLILSPIPASLTNESYAVIRATTMLPIPEILIGISIFFLIDKVAEKFRLMSIFIIIVLVFLSLESYLSNYFVDYTKNYSWSWQYGYKQIVNYANTNYSKYDNIIVTKKYAEPHEYFLFYLKYDPLKYINDANKITFQQSNWWWVDHFDKFWFVNDWQVKDLVTESKIKIDCVTKKCLLITSPDNFPKGFTKLDTINFLDGKPAFEIYENN